LPILTKQKKAGQLTGDPLFTQKTVSVGLVTVLETVLQKWVKVGQFASDPLFAQKTTYIVVITVLEPVLQKWVSKFAKKGTGNLTKDLASSPDPLYLKWMDLQGPI
jgi:hypothetical protein